MESISISCGKKELLVALFRIYASLSVLKKRLMLSYKSYFYDGLLLLSYTAIMVEKRSVFLTTLQLTLLGSSNSENYHKISHVRHHSDFSVHASSPNCHRVLHVHNMINSLIKIAKGLLFWNPLWTVITPAAPQQLQIKNWKRSKAACGPVLCWGSLLVWENLTGHKVNLQPGNHQN